MGLWFSKMVSSFFLEQEDCKQYFVALSSRWDLKAWNIWIIKQGETFYGKGGLIWMQRIPYNFQECRASIFLCNSKFNFCYQQECSFMLWFKPMRKSTHGFFHSSRWSFLNVLSSMQPLLYISTWKAYSSRTAERNVRRKQRK